MHPLVTDIHTVFPTAWPRGIFCDSFWFGISVQELCDCQCGRPWLPIPNSPYGHCERKVLWKKVWYGGCGATKFVFVLIYFCLLVFRLFLVMYFIPFLFFFFMRVFLYSTLCLRSGMGERTMEMSRIILLQEDFPLGECHQLTAACT